MPVNKLMLAKKRLICGRCNKLKLHFHSTGFSSLKFAIKATPSPQLPRKSICSECKTMDCSFCL